MSKAITLYPTRQEGVFGDQAGRFWIVNDARKPGANPPEEPYCTVCGLTFGPVTYMRNATGGAVACHRCVEVTGAPDPAERVVVDEGQRRVTDASEEHSR